MITFQGTSLHEKMEAMAQIRKKSHLPLFKLAIKVVLTQFHQIESLALQLEIVNVVGKSQHTDLIKDLQKIMATRQRHL